VAVAARQRNNKRYSLCKYKAYCTLDNDHLEDTGIVDKMLRWLQQQSVTRFGGWKNESGLCIMADFCISDSTTE
jgi:hypothetical protein